MKPSWLRSVCINAVTSRGWFVWCGWFAHAAFLSLFGDGWWVIFLLIPAMCFYWRVGVKAQQREVAIVCNVMLERAGVPGRVAINEELA